MGGRHVTLGSDAHTAGQVGSGLEAAVQALRTAGIHAVTRFHERRAELLPLV